MPNINKANRTCCDVDIRVLKTMVPFLDFDNANVTTVGFSSEDTFAKAKGANKVAFSNPMDGTMSIEAQVKPFKLYAMLSDGEIETTAVVAEKKSIICTVAGSLTLPVGVKAGTVFVYTKGDYAGEIIEGTLTGDTFTASEASKIEENTVYEVGYLIEKTTGIQKISLNNKKTTQDYYITMKTVEKDEQGVITPYIITGYKCKPKKSLELSFSSEGDPATVKIELSCLEDKDGNVIDMIEYTEPEV